MRNAVAFAGLCFAVHACASSHAITSVDRGRVQFMLQEVASDVRENYYDPGFHGVDWEAQVAKAREKIATAESLNMALSHVAAALASLDDSHTGFIPPARPYRHDYDFRFQMVGERCLVTQVRPGGDAEAKGLKPGHELLAVNGFRAARDSLWKIHYVFNVLQPQAGLHLNLKDLSGEEREMDVLAHTEQITGGGAQGMLDYWDLVREEENDRDLNRGEVKRLAPGLVLVKLRRFDFDTSDLAALVGKTHPESMVLDLRGNPGGRVDVLQAALGYLFGRQVKIGDRVTREKTEPLVAKAGDEGAFSGRLVVLVDSKSASSSEVLARVVQLEKRGTVIGDHTSGSVMEGRRFRHSTGAQRRVFYGAMVTDANLIMADGNSLERAGVMPDEVMFPDAADLIGGRDPVLARAVELLGAKISAQDAGRLFPYKWPNR